MSLQDFTRLWNDLDLYDIYFSERELPTIYNLSMMTNIDEINSDKHLEMKFVEFLEAFSRIAEIYSPLPLDEDVEDWTENDRMRQSLPDKIGNFTDLLVELENHKKIEIAEKKQMLEKANSISADTPMSGKLS